MKMIRLLISIFLVTFLCQYPSSVLAQQSLAYTDDFVWYLSGRLTNERITFLRAVNKEFSELESNETQMQLQIIYHHFLVECDGPLSEIDMIVGSYDYGRTLNKNDANVLAYVGSMDYAIWPIVQKWHAKNIDRIMNLFKSGQYGFFPQCVVVKYLQQNPIPKED